MEGTCIVLGLGVSILKTRTSVCMLYKTLNIWWQYRDHQSTYRCNLFVSTRICVRR